MADGKDESNAVLLSAEETQALVRQILRALIASAWTSIEPETPRQRRARIRRIERDMERLAPGSVAWARERRFLP